MDSEESNVKDVYISSKHDKIRRELVGSKDEIFSYAWELLAYAASLGWQIGICRNHPERSSGGATVKIPNGEIKRGDSVLVDMVGFLEFEKRKASGEDLNPANFVKELEEIPFQKRCDILAGYADCGLDYVSAKRERIGGSYEEVVLEIMNEEIDKSLLDPSAAMGL
jgi:hypothetical protein